MLEMCENSHSQNRAMKLDLTQTMMLTQMIIQMTILEEKEKEKENAKITDKPHENQEVIPVVGDQQSESCLKKSK